MSCVCTLALRSMVARPSARWASTVRVRRRITAQPTIALSGVRSSWDSVARNSSFSRLACSASSRAARSPSSNCVRSSASWRNLISLSARALSVCRSTVMSRSTREKPTSRPDASRIAAATPLVRRRSPSGRTSQRSLWLRPCAAAVASSSSIARGRALLEQHGDRPADDVRLRVAGHPLGPGVPAHDPSLHRDGDDGVVAHAVDQQPVALFARAERLLGAPLAQQGVDRGDELDWLDRPNQIAVGAGVEALGLVAAAGVAGRQVQHGNAARRRIGLDDPTHLDAADVRQAHVEDDDVGVLTNLVERLAAVGPFDHVEPGLTQHARHDVAIGFVVVDVQHDETRPRSSRSRGFRHLTPSFLAAPPRSRPTRARCRRCRSAAAG